MGHTPAGLVVTVPATYSLLFLVTHSQNTELNTPTLLPGKNEDLHLEVRPNLSFFSFSVDRKSIERRMSWKVILAMRIRNPASALFQKGSPFEISVPVSELLSNVHTLILITALLSNRMFVILISR